MKKVTCFSLLTMLVLVLTNYETAAQCNQSGSSYSCSAVAPVYYDYNTFNEWVSGSDFYTVNVYLETYEENDPNYEPYVYADIWTDNFYWSAGIPGGNYQDSFNATAEIGGLIGLYVYARGGEAHISASW
jgi:hypothetical protein